MSSTDALGILVIIASLALLAGVYYSFKLSKETRHEKYWLLLALGFFIFAVHHWMMIPFLFGIIEESARLLIEQLSSIIAAVLIAYSMHGLYSSMKKINRKLE